MTDRALRIVLVALGLVQLGFGSWMTFATNSFGTNVASFDGFNGHDLRDFATFYLALGIALLVSARLRHWRLPILVLATLEYAFHTVSHIVDVSNAHPAWIGPVELGAIAAGTALFACLAAVSARRNPSQSSP